MTSGDNSNVLVARVARDAFGIERVVARIYDPRRAAIYERLGIPTVASVQWTTDRVRRRISEAGPVEWTDPTASVQLVERKVPGRWAAHRLSELEEASGARAVALSRNGATTVPTGDPIAQDGDVVWFSVAAGDAERLEVALAATSDDGGHH